MASQVSPGVVLRERDLTNATIVGDSALTAAFSSSFQKGPIGVITSISDQKAFINTFGTPSDANAEDWLVASEFLGYGGRLAVVRAATGVQNAANAGGVLIKNDDEWNAGTGAAKIFAARSAGTWGNGVKVVAVDRGPDQIITLAGAPANNTPTEGGSVTFNTGAGAKTAEVQAVSGTTITVVLDDPTVLIDTGDTYEDGATDISITSAVDWYTNTEITGTGLKLSVVGPRPGTSEFASSRGISYDEIHVAAIDTTGDVSGAANTVLERFTYLSKLSDGKSPEGASTYYKDIVNLQSQYIFHGAALTGTFEPNTTGGGKTIGVASSTLASGDVFLLVGGNETALSGGTDDYAYTAGEVNAGYDLFLDTEETEVDFVLMGGSMGAEADTKSKAQKVVAIAAGRKDAIAFVSPHKGNQVGSGGTALSAAQQKTNTLNFMSGMTSTSYAVLDSGYKYMYDRFNDKYRYVACNGDIAGLCVNTSVTNADWISPAGLSRGGVRNVVKLAYNPNKADRDELYQARINPIVSFPGTGSVLFGDKTALSSTSAFDRINVRRLFLNIEKRVERLGKSVLFEMNDEVTRGGFLSTINAYLNDIVAQQGITDFLVVCDTSNNTADVIDRNEFVAELFIKPARSINYVTVTFTATRTGVSFSEVVGR